MSPMQSHANSTVTNPGISTGTRTLRSASHTPAATHSSAVLDQLHGHRGSSVVPNDVGRSSSHSTDHSGQQHRSQPAITSSPPRRVPAPLGPATMNLMTRDEQDALVQRLMGKGRAYGSSRTSPSSELRSSTIQFRSTHVFCDERVAVEDTG